MQFKDVIKSCMEQGTKPPPVSPMRQFQVTGGSITCDTNYNKDRITRKMMALQKMVMFSMAFVALLVATGSTVAHADATGMSLTAMAEDGSDTIMVTGHTTGMQQVLIRVEDPIKNLILVGQLTPDANGEFSKEIKIGGMAWMQDGKYTITAQQGEASLYKLKIDVMIVGGMAMQTDSTQSTFENILVPNTGMGMEMSGLEVEAMWEEGNPVVPITGTTDNMQEEVTLKVTSPNGNIVYVDQVMPDNSGKFMTELVTGCGSWNEDGDYVLSANQGSAPQYRDTAVIPIAECMPVPEFGAIAAMILAVALVSIIAFTARSRLGIVPRY